ncbi:molecular chaperone DnaK, partial [Streptomyces sp. NPDC002889]
DVKSEVETALGELKEKLKGEDTAEIRTATEKAAAVSQKLGQAMYAEAKAQQSAGGPGHAGADAGADTGRSTDSADEVVDAEIVDDDKQQGGAG